MSTKQSFSFLQEREMDLEDLGSIRRIKLEQCVQLCQFENDANQVKKVAEISRKFTIKWPI